MWESNPIYTSTTRNLTFKAHGSGGKKIQRAEGLDLFGEIVSSVCGIDLHHGSLTWLLK